MSTGCRQKRHPKPAADQGGAEPKAHLDVGQKKFVQSQTPRPGSIGSQPARANSKLAAPLGGGPPFCRLQWFNVQPHLIGLSITAPGARDGADRLSWGYLEPISKSFEEDDEAGKLDEAEEIVGVVLPANEDRPS